MGGQLKPAQLLAALLASILVSAPVLEAAGSPATDDGLSRLRGHAICPEPLATAAPENDPCNELGTPFTFATEDGEIIAFIDGDPMAEMFTDPRIRSQLLEIRGWRRGPDRFELLSVYSIKNGVRHHVHYRCDVCDIDATAPGPCWCCGQPFELREDPIDEADSP